MLASHALSWYKYLDKEVNGKLASYGRGRFFMPASTPLIDRIPPPSSCIGGGVGVYYPHIPFDPADGRVVVVVHSSSRRLLAPACFVKLHENA